MNFKEAKLVENHIVQNLQKEGWTFVPANELERDNYEEPLLFPNLIRALEMISQMTTRGGGLF